MHDKSKDSFKAATQTNTSASSNPLANLKSKDDILLAVKNMAKEMAESEFAKRRATLHDTINQISNDQMSISKKDNDSNISGDDKQNQDSIINTNRNQENKNSIILEKKEKEDSEDYSGSHKNDTDNSNNENEDNTFAIGFKLKKQDSINPNKLSTTNINTKPTNTKFNKLSIKNYNSNSDASDAMPDSNKNQDKKTDIIFNMNKSPSSFNNTNNLQLADKKDAKKGYMSINSMNFTNSLNPNKTKNPFDALKSNAIRKNTYSPSDMSSSSILEEEEEQESIDEIDLSTIREDLSQTFYDKNISILDKKKKQEDHIRALRLKDELKELKSKPQIDKKSKRLMKNKPNYKPIYERFPEVIRSKKEKELFQKKIQEEKEYSTLSSIKGGAQTFFSNYNQQQEFVEGQYIWLMIKEQKIQAYREEMERLERLQESNYYKPSINDTAHQMFSNENENVFDRLHKHAVIKERKIECLVKENTPCFKPRTNSSLKPRINFNGNRKSSVDNAINNNIGERLEVDIEIEDNYEKERTNKAQLKSQISSTNRISRLKPSVKKPQPCFSGQIKDLVRKHNIEDPGFFSIGASLKNSKHGSPIKDEKLSEEYLYRDDENENKDYLKVSAMNELKASHHKNRIRNKSPLSEDLESEVNYYKSKIISEYNKANKNSDNNNKILGNLNAIYNHNFTSKQINPNKFNKIVVNSLMNNELNDDEIDMEIEDIYEDYLANIRNENTNCNIDSEMNSVIKTKIIKEGTNVIPKAHKVDKNTSNSYANSTTVNNNNNNNSIHNRILPKKNKSKKNISHLENKLENINKIDFDDYLNRINDAENTNNQVLLTNPSISTKRLLQKSNKINNSNNNVNSSNDKKEFKNAFHTNNTKYHNKNEEDDFFDQDVSSDSYQINITNIPQNINQSYLKSIAKSINNQIIGNTNTYRSSGFNNSNKLNNKNPGYFVNNNIISSGSNKIPIYDYIGVNKSNNKN